MLLTTVTGSSFNFQTSHSLTHTFDTDVHSTVSLDDFFLNNLTSNSVVAGGSLSQGFNGAGTISTIRFPGLTGTGNLSGIVSDGNWETIIEQEGVAGLAAAYVYSFYFLNGDVNGSRSVGGDDFNIFAQYNGTPSGATFSQCDLNYDGAVNSSDYNILATNFGKQMPAPLTGSNTLSTNATSNHEVNLTWTAPANGTPDGYRIWRSLDGVTYTYLDYAQGAGNLNYPDGTLTDGVKRWYRVRPYTTANGNGATTNESSSVTVMNAPSGLSVTAVSTGGTNLSWTNNSSSATGFKIERSLTPKSGYSEVTTTTTTATTYHDATALENTTYYYRVSAVNSVAESAPCNRVSATTVAVNAPGNVGIFAASATQMQVNWTDNSSVESSFTVRLTGGGQTHTFSNVASNSTGYLATGLTEGVTYSATVQAIGASASSVQSVASNSTFTWGTSKLVYTTDFDGSDPEWSPNPHVNDYPTFPGTVATDTSKSLGLFGNTSTTLTLQGLPPHTAVEVDYGLIYNAFSPSSGLDASPATLTVTSGTQSVQSFRMDVFPNSGLWTAFPGGTPTFGHQGSSLTMQFQLDGLESVNNEQWAMTFCRVTIKRSTVSVGLMPATAIENDEDHPLAYLVHRSEPLFGSLEVQLTATAGTATEGSDFTALPGSLTLPDGEAQGWFYTHALLDDENESDETIVKGIEPSPLYAMGSPATTQAVIPQNGVTLTVPSELWWFNGEDAQNYTETATASFTAQNIKWNGVTWKLTGRTNAADLNNGGNDADTVTAQPPDTDITVKSTGWSLAQQDATLELSLDERKMTEAPMTVFKPATATVVQGYPQDAAHGTGYNTRYVMRVDDQFGSPVPRALEVNESFGTITNVIENNWGGFHANGQLTSKPDWAQTPSYFADDYGGEGGDPSYLNPGANGAGTLVQEVVQSYRAGSETPGKGVIVKAHILKLYRGYARQTQ